MGERSVYVCVCSAVWEPESRACAYQANAVLLNYIPGPGIIASI